MARIKQAGPSVLVVALLAGIVGYILGCSQSDRERKSEARAEIPDQVAQNDQAPKAAAAPATKYSPVKTHARDFYTPNSEDLGPNEMRLIACGTGMPTARPKQAASCWLLELGNGDKFIFDVGSGSRRCRSRTTISIKFS
jgi:hypothetical protein